jgi:hypothetical protein
MSGICMSVTVIRVFKMFLPQIQTEFAKCTRFYDHSQDTVYLFVSMYLVTACFS